MLTLLSHLGFLFAALTLASAPSTGLNKIQLI